MSSSQLPHGIPYFYHFHYLLWPRIHNRHSFNHTPVTLFQFINKSFHSCRNHPKVVTLIPLWCNLMNHCSTQQLFAQSVRRGGKKGLLELERCTFIEWETRKQLVNTLLLVWIQRQQINSKPLQIHMQFKGPITPTNGVTRPIEISHNLYANVGSIVIYGSRLTTKHFQSQCLAKIFMNSFLLQSTMSSKIPPSNMSSWYKCMLFNFSAINWLCIPNLYLFF